MLFCLAFVLHALIEAKAEADEDGDVGDPEWAGRPHGPYCQRHAAGLRLIPNGRIGECALRPSRAGQPILRLDADPCLLTLALA